MAIRDYRGSAAPATLAVEMLATDLTAQCSALTNWPTGGANGKFFVTLGRGTPNEERALASSRSGDIVTFSSLADRGMEDTGAVLHPAGTTIEHTFSATDADEANRHIFDTTQDQHTQYYNAGRHDIPAAHTFGAALGTPATPTPLTVGSAGSVGSAAGPPRADHRHEITTAIASTIIGVNVEGTSSAAARADHNHALSSAILAMFVPTGGAILFGGGTAPSGFLLCQGQAISRTTYSNLFAVIGTNYGVGDGATTFNLPDFERRFPLGKASSGVGSTLGDTGGTFGHTHALSPGHALLTFTAGSPYVRMFRRSGVSAWNQNNEVTTALALSSASGSNTTAIALGGSSDSADPPYTVVNYIMKT